MCKGWWHEAAWPSWGGHEATGRPGFKAYSIAKSGDEILSFSAWASAADAEEANEAAASWIAENMSDDIELEETLIGEVLLSTTLGVSTTAGVRA